MARAAILGRPVTHSLSPVLHGAAYSALGLTGWTYEVIDCGEDQLAGLLALCATPEWVGFSCTRPLKRAVLRVADIADELAVAVGAANTLVHQADGRWRAATTDAAGILGALAESDIRPGSVTVLGAGGTAQNALAAVRQLGLTRCSVLVRDPARTVELAATAERLALGLDIGRLDVAAAALDADLVIATLPAGAADPLAARAWRPGQAILDAVYDPWPTALAAAAAAGGATVVSGALMLLHQAVGQVELMTGRAAPLEAMRAALRRHDVPV